MIKVEDLMKILSKHQTIEIFEENTNVILYCTGSSSISKDADRYEKVRDKEVTCIENCNGDGFSVYVHMNVFR